MADHESAQASEPKDSADELVRVAPKARVSRLQLVIAFAVMICTGLGVYQIFPESIGGDELPVQVELAQSPVQTPDGQMAVLAKVIRVTNILDQPIRNLKIELNDQYLLYRDSPILPGETLDLPQEIFTDKRSSQRFDPDSQDITEVTVAGQLPSNARGISQFHFGG